MSMCGILSRAVLILLVGMMNHAFALDLSQWKYCAEATIEEGASEYCRLTLTPEIYNVAKPDLGDIRLTDAAGNQIPYVVVQSKDIQGRKMYEPAVINRSTNASRAALVTLDFGDKTTKNSVEVTTGGGNFRRAVKIEGSNDNIEFFTLVEHAYIFAVRDDRRFEQVDLPANDYRYLRISVLPMPAEQDSPVIGAVKASRIEQSRAERQAVNIVLTEHREDGENRSSIYVYDLGHRLLPVTEIELDIADDSFYRYVSLEGRDAATRQIRVHSEDNRQRFREVEVNWERIVSDVIYRYIAADGKKHERLVLRLPSGMRAHKYLRITIKNYDDKPVSLKSALANMMAHEIVFENTGNLAPLLYVGLESAITPRYDLKQRLSDPLQVSASIARLGSMTGNPLFRQTEPEPLAWTEKHKGLLLTVLVGVVLVLGAFILKSFKSIQSEQAQD
ncbi:MAG: DUF3999 family protein [Phycisphaerales bacterium]|nr:MAG: DUF3999 family protein [Phycisphaerales bacterium]